MRHEIRYEVYVELFRFRWSQVKLVSPNGIYRNGIISSPIHFWFCALCWVALVLASWQCFGWQAVSLGAKTFVLHTCSCFPSSFFLLPSSLFFVHPLGQSANRCIPCNPPPSLSDKNAASLAPVRAGVCGYLYFAAHCGVC